MLRGYEGSQKIYRDVMDALEAVKAYYAQTGQAVSVSFPPEQDITAGTIKLRITSAKDRMRLRNVRGDSAGPVLCLADLSPIGTLAFGYGRSDASTFIGFRCAR